MTIHKKIHGKISGKFWKILIRLEIFEKILTNTIFFIGKLQRNYLLLGFGKDQKTDSGYGPNGYKSDKDIGHCRRSSANLSQKNRAWGGLGSWKLFSGPSLLLKK